MGIVVNRTRLNPFPVKSVTGEFISIDDAVNRPVKKLEIDFAPKQSFNGYDYPWVGGSGKNKFDTDNANWKNEYYLDASGVEQSNTAYKYTQAFTPVLSSTQYVMQMNKTTADNVGLTLCEYDENQTFIQRNTIVSATTETGVLSGTFTTTATTKYIRFSAPYLSSASEFGSYHFQLETGSSATAWSPYSNICPITGYTGLTVADDSRYGGFVDWNQLITNGNFADGTTGWRASTLGALIASDGILTLYATSSSNRSWAVSTDATITSGHKYIALGGFRRDYNGTDSDAKTWYVRVYGNSEQRVKALSTPSGGDTTIIDCVFMATDNNSSFGIHPSGALKPSAGTWLFSIWNIQLFDITQMFGDEIADSIYEMEQAETGSGVAYFKSIFPHTYYEYDSGGTLKCVSRVNGEDSYWVVPVSWQTEAGEVFGGTLDLVSGVLTVQYRSLGISSFNFGRANGVFRSNTWYTSASSATDGYCTHYKATSSSPPNAPDMSINFRSRYWDSNNRIFIKDSRFTNGDDWRAWATENNVRICTKLSPYERQLTPHQISTLMGSNRIWTDVGTISLDYRAMRSAQNTPLLGMLGNPSVPEEPA